MNNLLKMEKYQLSHNIFYWCGLIGIFLINVINLKAEDIYSEMD